MATRVLRVLAAAGIVAVVLLGFGASTGDAGEDAPVGPSVCDTTSGGDAPVEFTAEMQRMAGRFSEAIGQLVAERGLDESGVPALIGEPGDLDLPPGDATLLGTIDAVCADTLPGGGAAALAGPCQGIALSFDGDGNPLDAAADFSDPGPPVDLTTIGDGEAAPAFTSSNPFEVDVNGYVLYAGIAGPPGGGPTNHTWELTTMGVSVDSGGDDNPEGENLSAGSVDLGADFPLKINALFNIAGQMRADNGFACTGNGFFRTTGGAPILLAVGAVITVGAIGFGALFNARPSITIQSSELGL